MAFAMNHNMMATNTVRHLNFHYGNLNTSTQRLSSGLRINGAADDAAGLAIRELMRADIAALNQGVRNVNDAISMIQTADGALATIDAQLIRMKELTEQAATGTYDSVQRLMIESEYQQLAKEITRIANATDFNGIKLLDGSLDRNAPLTLSGEAVAFLEEEYKKTRTGSTASALMFTYDPVTGDATGLAQNTTISNLIAEASGATLSKSAGVGNMGAGDYDRLEYQNASAAIMNVLNKLIPSGINYNKLTTAEVANIPGGEKYSDAVTPTGTAHVTLAQISEALTGSADVNKEKGILIHFGPLNDSAEDYYYIDIGCSTAQALGLGHDSIENAGNNIKTQAAAGEALEAIEDAIISKDKIRAHLGAMHNRLEATADNLTVQSENIAAAESRISDTDVSMEMTNFVRNQILTQAAVAMLSQANNLPKMVLNLIDG